MERKTVDISEFSLPIIALLWAAWFALFDSVNSTSVYAPARFMTSVEWSLVFGVVGMAQSAATVFGDPCWRRRTVAASVVLWAVWSILTAIGNYQSSATVTTAFLAWMSVLTFKKIGCSEK